MGKAKRKRARKLQRQRDALVNPQPAEIIIDGPDCDPQQLWRDHVTDYAHGYIEEDGQGWNPNGYL